MWINRFICLIHWSLPIFCFRAVSCCVRLFPPVWKFKSPIRTIRVTPDYLGSSVFSVDSFHSFISFSFQNSACSTRHITQESWPVSLSIISLSLFLSLSLSIYLSLSLSLFLVCVDMLGLVCWISVTSDFLLKVDYAVLLHYVTSLLSWDHPPRLSPVQHSHTLQNRGLKHHSFHFIMRSNTTTLYQ